MGDGHHEGVMRRPTPTRGDLAAPAPKLALLLLLSLGLACSEKSSGSSVSPLPPASSDFEAVRVFTGLSSPVDLQAPPGDTARVFIVEKTGRIRIAKHGVLLARPFLDLSAIVSTGSEQGLLGLAFHPDFASNGRFFVDYTNLAGDTRVESYTASSDPDSAVPSATPILAVDQPYPNHNGGQIAFGPDGFLYVGLGDGGSGGDPQGNGQSLATLLGKILRIDVDAAAPYAVPPSNPFVGRAGARTEIWSYGLRNPWRFSFDATSGAMWIGDVGQNAWEEIDVEPLGMGGRNYGWNRLEGTHCYPAGSPCNQSGTVLPLLEYGHDAGCSVTGGYVYRGSALPELDGTYFYGDFCTGMIRSARFSGVIATDMQDWTSVLRSASGGALINLSSFGVDSRGELYILRLDGEVYRLRRKP
jgi:glucose/arabinose dehydrogenase